jgi:hypothetical protein
MTQNSILFHWLSCSLEDEAFVFFLVQAMGWARWKILVGSVGLTFNISGVGWVSWNIPMKLLWPGLILSWVSTH